MHIRRVDAMPCFVRKISRRSSTLILLLGLLLGCGSQPATSQPATQPAAKQPARRPEAPPVGGTEMLVRAAIAKVTKMDASAIQMDRAIGEPPLKADDLVFVEIILELESRAGIDISEATMERHGKLGDGPVKVTPAQLVKMVEDSPKAGAP